MTKIPKKVMEAIENADVYTLATATKDGAPNVVYIGYLKALDDETVLIADNKMDKTKKNILENPKAAFSMRDKEAGSYQVKGTVEYRTCDKYHDEVKGWCRKDLDRKGAVVMHVEEVYSGAKRLA